MMCSPITVPTTANRLGIRVDEEDDIKGWGSAGAKGEAVMVSASHADGRGGYPDLKLHSGTKHPPERGEHGSEAEAQHCDSHDHGGSLLERCQMAFSGLSINENASYLYAYLNPCRSFESGRGFLGVKR
jgi:hypothetical protein